MKIQAYALDESVEYNKVCFGKATSDGSAVAQFLVKNTGDEAASDVILSAIRGDMLNQGGARYADEEIYNANANGEELVNERWLQVRKVGDTTWVDVDEFDHSFSLGALDIDASVEVEARVKPAEDAQTSSDVYFNLVLRIPI